MKLVENRSPSNVYESFSDLIFCTLILFVFIVLILSLSINAKVTSLIKRNAFSGRGGRPHFALTYLIKSDKDMNIIFKGSDNIYSYNDFFRIQNNIDTKGDLFFITSSLKFASKEAKDSYKNVLEELIDRRIKSGRLSASEEKPSGEDSIFGRLEKKRKARLEKITEMEEMYMVNYIKMLKLRKKQEMSWKDYKKYLLWKYTYACGYDDDIINSQLDYERRNFKKPLTNMIEKDERRAKFEDNMEKKYMEYRKRGKPCLWFTADPEKQRIILGPLFDPLILTPKQFVEDILSSIKGGDGFYIEYRGINDLKGEVNEMPPEWIIKKVLEPSGYTNFLVSGKLSKIKGSDKIY